MGDIKLIQKKTKNYKTLQKVKKKYKIIKIIQKKVTRNNLNTYISLFFIFVNSKSKSIFALPKILLFSTNVIVICMEKLHFTPPTTPKSVIGFFVDSGTQLCSFGQNFNILT